MKPKLIIILMFLLAFPGISQAAPTVRATVDRTRLALGESLQLTVSVSGDKGQVDTSPIWDFKVISRGTTNSINMVNGNFSQELIYTYTLIPLKEGQFRIPPLPVSFGGGTLYTKEITIRVSRRPQQYANARKDVFTDARVSDKSPYEGQQVIYTFRLCQTARIDNAKFQRPDFKGFTVKKIEGEKSYKTAISGRQYHVTELNYILIPLSSGPKHIEAAILNCDIVRRANRQRSFFDRVRLEPRVFQTDGLTVQVRPLPPYEGTVPFSGLVGTFEIHSQMETGTLKVGDSTTLTTVIEGSGNIVDAEAPKIEVSEAFKVYADAPEEDIRLEADGYSGKKIFRTALVPMKPGEYTLPPVQLAYFDTAAGQYVTRSAPALPLKVLPSENPAEPTVFSASPASPEKQLLKKKVEFTGRDILPLKEEIDALTSQQPLSLFRFILFLLGPAAICLVIRGALILTRKSDDPSRIMAARAEKALKAAAADRSGDAFLTQLYQALVSVIFSKAGTRGESLTYREAEAMLCSNGCSPETAEKAAKLLERVESAKFSGLGMDQTAQKDLLTETREMFRILSR